MKGTRTSSTSKQHLTGQSDAANLSMLEDQLRELNYHFSQYLSLPRAFVLSIVKGVGYAIGATIVASIIAAVVSQTIRSVRDIPFVGSMINDQFIESLDSATQ